MGLGVQHICIAENLSLSLSVCVCLSVCLSVCVTCHMFGTGSYCPRTYYVDQANGKLSDTSTSHVLGLKV